MKKIILLILLAIFSNAQELSVNNFEADLYSKEGRNTIKKVNLDIILIGRDVEENENPIIDSINIIIGSYFVEDILTSMGKQKFKDDLIKFLGKKYSVEVDEIYIKKLYILTDTKASEIIEALKQSGYCLKKE